MTGGSSDWWARPGLARDDSGELRLAGRAVAAMARSSGTPVYLYDADRVRRNLARLREAMAGAGLRSRVFYAMKSNRNPSLLTFLRATGGAGIDACSPREVRRAVACGFPEEEISFTAGSLSDRDLDVLALHPGVIVNLDSLSAIERFGRRAPGREIGLRIDPGTGVGYGANDLLAYAGTKPTKFGFSREALPGALDAARRAKLSVVGLHVHAGCGYLTPQLPAFGRVLDELVACLALVPGARRVNVGGGLGIPLVAGDEPLDLAAWASLVAGKLGGFDGELQVEPGDYLVKDSGILVVEVNSVEERRGTLFVGVDAGFNVHLEPAFYRLPLEPVPVRVPPAGAAGEVTVTLAGNINEALDLLAEGVRIPRPEPGDLLALLNAGGYGASMASDHCLRGDFAEILLL